MRFFKYLVFLLLFIPALTNAAFYAFFGESSGYQTPQARCTAWQKDSVFVSAPSSPNIVGSCKLNGQSLQWVRKYGEDECPFPDYKIVSQSITSLKKSMCLPINGTVCKYVGDPTGSPIINGSITTTFNSVSKTPDPTCKEDLVNPPCDPKDPYGGCFTPPDDGCTRQFDGSIECPADTVPPVEKGCNGATYCDRPPQGCGEGYVSGSYNGKQICIKTSPSNGNPPDDGDTGNTGEGSGTSTTTGTETTTTTTTNSDGSTSTSTSTTTTNNTTVNNFKIDLSGVIAAVKAVSSQLSSLKNELLTSLTDLSNKLGLTNLKLDTTNQKLNEINDSSLRQEDLLKAIRDKQSPTTGGDGSPSDHPASGASTDLTETNGILNDIKDALTKEPDLSPLKADVPTGELTQQSLKTDIFGSTAQCPADRVLNLPLLTKTYHDSFSYQTLCSNLAIVGFLIMIFAYCLGAYIVSKA